MAGFHHVVLLFGKIAVLRAEQGGEAARVLGGYGFGGLLQFMVYAGLIAQQPPLGALETLRELGQ